IRPFGSAQRPIAETSVGELRVEKAPSRYRRDRPHFREDSELVQAPDGAQMKEKSPVAAAREAERHSLPRLLRRRNVLLDRMLGRRRRFFDGRHGDSISKSESV